MVMDTTEKQGTILVSVSQGPKMPLASAIRAAGSREFWVITLANLLVMTSYYLVFVVTAAYVRETWHTSLSVAGLAVGVMIMGCLVGRFVSGNLVSLLGCKKILWTGLVLYQTRRNTPSVRVGM